MIILIKVYKYSQGRQKNMTAGFTEQNSGIFLIFWILPPWLSDDDRTTPG